MSSRGGKASPEFLQKIKEAVSILEVVGEHVVLRHSGANSTGLCPFHSERSPSFSVSQAKGLYYCYGCKKSGDLITFVMDIHGMSFHEAIEDLAERARIALPSDWYGGGTGSDDPEVQKRRKEARDKLHVLYKLNMFAMAFYRQQVGQLPAVERYFKNRGVQGDLATNFRVGAAPPAWDALARHMLEKKAPLQQATELGLLRPSTKTMPGSTGYFDLFRDRAMFPIIDMRGRVAGFGGRMMPAAPGAEQAQAGEPGPKYMNSPESSVFQKSRLAFGLFQAQKHIREKDEVILVEGYFDVLALHAAGFENVVATCGTSLTPDHLTLFRRFAKRVTVLFDGDKAGVSATERAMEVGLDNGVILFGAALPSDLDPDELLFDQETGKPLAEGKSRMAEILGAAQPLLATQLKSETLTAAGGPEARTQALKKVAGWLKRYTDPVGREVWLEEAIRGLGVSRALLDQAMGGRVTSGGGAASTVRVQPVSGVTRPGPIPNGATSTRVVIRSGAVDGAGRAAKPSRGLKGGEKILLQGLAKGGEFSTLFVEARSKLPREFTLADLFDYEPAKQFVGRLVTEPGYLELFRAAPERALDEELDPQVRSTLTEALVSQEPLFEKNDFQLSLDKGMGRVWARFSQRIKIAVAEAEAKQDAGLHAELMKEYLDVQRKIKEFISFYDEA
jgi:DNA primase